MPLHWAVSRKASVEVVKALLEAHDQATQSTDEVRSASALDMVGATCVFTRPLLTGRQAATT